MRMMRENVTFMAKPFHAERGIVTQVMNLRFASRSAFLANRWSDNDSPFKCLMNKIFGDKLSSILFIGAAIHFANLVSVLFAPFRAIGVLTRSTFWSMRLFPCALTVGALLSMFLLVCTGISIGCFSIACMPAALSLKNAFPIFEVLLLVVGFLNFGVFEGHGGNIS